MIGDCGGFAAGLHKLSSNCVVYRKGGQRGPCAPGRVLQGVHYMRVAMR